MRVAVAGGTGVVGRHVVKALEQRGHEAVTLSRRTGTDLTTGDGLDGALEGVAAIVDTTNPTSMNPGRAIDFFTRVSANLQAAGGRTGVERLVLLSIVGIDRVPLGYYRAKLRHEEAGRAGPLPSTVVRATQFHEFPLQVMSRAHVGSLRLVPDITVQPVAAASVGQFLAEVALAPPSEDLFQVAGPRTEKLLAMARQVLARTGRRGTVVGLPLPGSAGRAMRRGGLVPGPEARTIGPTFEEWLKGDDWRAVAGLRPPG